jgi:hypothetical protein
MGCSTMMFGAKVKYGITYKFNEKSFNLYRRKYEHEYMVNVMSDNLEGSKAMELKTMDVILCSKIDRVIIYDSVTFKNLGEIPITLLKTETREPNQVIAMQTCQNEEYLAIISGKNLIMNEQKINQLFIYKRKKSTVVGVKDSFEFETRIVLKDIEMQFYFQHNTTKERE